MFATDLDDDGDLDVVATAYWQGTVIWYKNDGNGNFNDSLVLFEGKYLKDAQAADLDRDGDLDVLAAIHGGHKVVWFESDGQGNFSTQKILRENVRYPLDENAVDVDRDGDMDVISVATSDGEIFWCENLMQPNQIITFLFHDRNENGLYDGDTEQPLFNFKLQLNPSQQETFTSLEGYHYLFADYGEYDLTFESNPL